MFKFYRNISLFLAAILLLTGTAAASPDNYGFIEGLPMEETAEETPEITPEEAEEKAPEEKEFIKWVDFNVSYPALEKAMQIDIDSYGSELHLDWIPLLSYLATKYGGDFTKYRSKDLDALVKTLKSGESMSGLTANMKYYPYYLEAYTAILGEFVGEYSVQVADEKPAEDNTPNEATPSNEGEPGALHWETRYGLKVFSPISAGFGYEHFDDFGSGRSYGYKRKHLGHDLFASVGTPIIAVESGIVEVMGWNQYGGWRIGIRSFDGTRYYYYAHLRKNFPYNSELAEGKTVKAGDVIGYMGRTGYSANENVNNIKESHLHLGLQLIFDESQKEGAKEIWVDLHAITHLLDRNRSVTYRVAETKEFYRQYDFDEPLLRDDDAINMQLEPEPELEAEMPSGDTTRIPIIMYHKVSKNSASLGKFTISPAELENDLSYLKENGFITVTMSDLIAYVHDGVPLPEKPIVLTFDDGYYSDYRYVFPILQEYEAKAILSVIGKVTDDYSNEGRTDINYPHLTWAQINEMLGTGLVEIQNHSYNLHSGGIGALKMRSESEYEYAGRLMSDLSRLQIRFMEMTGTQPTTFTYPFGAISKGSKEILCQLDFLASLAVEERIDTLEVGNPDCLFSLGRILRPHGTSSERFFSTKLKDMEYAKNNGRG